MKNINYKIGDIVYIRGRKSDGLGEITRLEDGFARLYLRSKDYITVKDIETEFLSEPCFNVADTAMYKRLKTGLDSEFPNCPVQLDRISEETAQTAIATLKSTQRYLASANTNMNRLINALKDEQQ
jgi:hypothetical protein